jgi:hypothetical protein
MHNPGGTSLENCTVKRMYKTAGFMRDGLRWSSGTYGDIWRMEKKEDGEEMGLVRKVVKINSLLLVETIRGRFLYVVTTQFNVVSTLLSVVTFTLDQPTLTVCLPFSELIHKFAVVPPVPASAARDEPDHRWGVIVE